MLKLPNALSLSNEREGLVTFALCSFVSMLQYMLIPSDSAGKGDKCCQTDDFEIQKKKEKKDEKFIDIR